MEVNYKIAKQHKGKPFLGEIELDLIINETVGLEIVENYQGNGFESQGQIIEVSSKGFIPWKHGIKSGIIYAYDKLCNIRGLIVKIKKTYGLATDTNPTILGYISSRAILDNLANFESDEQKMKIEKILFDSWLKDSSHIIDLFNHELSERILFEIDYLQMDISDSYLFARLINTKNSFELTSNSLFGGLPIKQEVTSPRATYDNGKPRMDIFAFRFKKRTDINLFKKGMIVELKE